MRAKILSQITADADLLHRLTSVSRRARLVLKRLQQTRDEIHAAAEKPCNLPCPGLRGGRCDHIAAVCHETSAESLSDAA